MIIWALHNSIDFPPTPGRYVFWPVFTDSFAQRLIRTKASQLAAKCSDRCFDADEIEAMLLLDLIR
ncbi:MAG: hypothetical protein AAFY56_18870, partial [Pseudomonadota bacterium]